MDLLHYSQSKAVRAALVAALLLILFPVLFKIVFAAKDEISYGVDYGLSTCGDFFIANEAEKLTCTASYNITLGNTGINNQQLVILDLTSVPEDVRISWNVVDIVATNRRPIGPRISSEQQQETLTFEIEDLEPNRLVEISLSVRGAESAKRLEDIALLPQATGSILNSNPRATVALRFFRNLGGIFGF